MNTVGIETKDKTEEKRSIRCSVLSNVCQRLKTQTDLTVLNFDYKIEKKRRRRNRVLFLEQWKWKVTELLWIIFFGCFWGITRLLALSSFLVFQSFQHLNPFQVLPFAFCHTTCFGFHLCWWPVVEIGEQYLLFFWFSITRWIRKWLKSSHHSIFFFRLLMYRISFEILDIHPTLIYLLLAFDPALHGWISTKIFN